MSETLREPGGVSEPVSREAAEALVPAGRSPEAEALLSEVQGMLNEEKWTRAALSNYSTTQFKDLDALIERAREARALPDLKKVCEEHLGHSKNSIIALYLSGMISVSQQIADDVAMVSLVSIFVDNRKWNLVRYLCEGVLAYGENKAALRTLAECCKNDNDEEALYGIWERLVRVDYEEADLAKALAERKEKAGDKEAAVDYYRKALHRYIAKGLFSNIREIWEKLLEYCPEDIDFFLNTQKRIAKAIDDTRAAQLLRLVYEACVMRDDWDTAIAVLKLILEYNDDDKQARRDITDCFRRKYAGHSQLDACIRVSSLSSGPRNVREAVADFEKHIAFDKGNFVYHRTWGVGRIAGVQGDDITIDFAKKRGHTMSVKMAVEALQTLPFDPDPEECRTHIWVLKATWKKEKLHERVKKNIPWTLKTVIRSFGNSCDLKRIKAELVPAVLTPGEWTGWNNKARDLLKTDAGFGVSPDDIDVYTVRDRPISVEEKLYSEFKAERDFFKRAVTLRAFAARAEVELDSDYFADMFGYFTAFLKSYQVTGLVNEQVVASYLLVKDLVGQFPHLGAGFQTGFTEIFEGIGRDETTLLKIFVDLRDLKLREDFLRQIQLFIPGWAEIFVSLFPRFPLPTIIAALEREGYAARLTGLAAFCFDNFREFREAAVWFCRNSLEAPWFQAADLSEEKRLITLIHILDLTYRDIDNRRDTSENRKINKQVYAILFKEDALGAFIDQADEDTVIRIYTFIHDVKSLDPSDKKALHDRIKARFPAFRFFADEEKKTATLGLLVTEGKLLEKQRQLQKIINEDLPANAKDLEYAKSLGDLRENAEYKAALEKGAILNNQMTRLNDEIGRAQVVDPERVSVSRVGFGTRVTLRSRNTGGVDEYTILGPWESDPNHGVISYLSPLGKAVMGKAVGEDVEISGGGVKKGEKTVYQVEAISKAI